MSHHDARELFDRQFERYNHFKLEPGFENRIVAYLVEQVRRQPEGIGSATLFSRLYQSLPGSKDFVKQFPSARKFVEKHSETLQFKENDSDGLVVLAGSTQQSSDVRLDEQTMDFLEFLVQRHGVHQLPDTREILTGELQTFRNLFPDKKAYSIGSWLYYASKLGQLLVVHRDGTITWNEPQVEKVLVETGHTSTTIRSGFSSAQGQYHGNTSVRSAPSTTSGSLMHGLHALSIDARPAPSHSGHSDTFDTSPPMHGLRGGSKPVSEPHPPVSFSSSDADHLQVDAPQIVSIAGSVDAVSERIGSSDVLSIAPQLTDGVLTRLFVAGRSGPVLQIDEVDSPLLARALEQYLTSPEVVKVLYASFTFAKALESLPQAKGVIDVEVAAEFVFGEVGMPLDEILNRCRDLQRSGSKADPAETGSTSRQTSVWPSHLPKSDPLHYTALVRKQLQVYDVLRQYHFNEPTRRRNIERASEFRLKKANEFQGKRMIVFDRANNYRPRSFEVLAVLASDKALLPKPIKAQPLNWDLGARLWLTNEVLKGHTVPDVLYNAADIILDVDRPVQVRSLAGKFETLPGDCIVRPTHIKSFVQNCLPESRADGAAQQWSLETVITGGLDRATVTRGPGDRVMSLTLRLARQVSEVSYCFTDLIRSSNRPRRILVTGQPATGKTTLLRDFARTLGQGVVLVDTYGELSGQDDAIHEAVGQARRVLVSDEDAQAAAIRKAARLLSPACLIVDELVNDADVTAFATAATQANKIIAGISCSFDQIQQHPVFQRLVGLSSDGRRTGAPLVDAIIETLPDQHSYRVVPNLSSAFANDGRFCPVVEDRTQDPKSGILRLQAFLSADGDPL